MNKEFFEALDLLEKEKGIPKEYMLGKVEAALITAFKRERGGSNVRVLIDENKKEVRVYEQMTVVEEVTDPMTESRWRKQRSTPSASVSAMSARSSRRPRLTAESPRRQQSRSSFRVSVKRNAA